MAKLIPSSMVSDGSAAATCEQKQHSDEQRATRASLVLATGMSRRKQQVLLDLMLCCSDDDGLTCVLPHGHSAASSLHSNRSLPSHHLVLCPRGTRAPDWHEHCAAFDGATLTSHT